MKSLERAAATSDIKYLTSWGFIVNHANDASSEMKEYAGSLQHKPSEFQFQIDYALQVRCNAKT